MPASDNLRRELESIEARIEDLQESLYRVDADLRAIRGRIGWLRALRVRALKVGIRRQIQELKPRRAAARACYAEAKGYEEWLRLGGRKRRPETLVRC